MTKAVKLAPCLIRRCPHAYVTPHAFCALHASLIPPKHLACLKLEANKAIMTKETKGYARALNACALEIEAFVRHQPLN